MGLLSHKVKRSDLEAGDHVYVYRFLGTYSHHGIYVGGDMVVHLSVNNFSSSSNCSASCSSLLSSDEHGCGFRKVGSAVTMTCLDCFMKKGSLCRYEYGVNKAAFILVKHRPGTCTVAKSDAAEKVIHRALYLLENGFGDYHLLKNNCESFALYCKTGLIIRNQRCPGGTGQATSAVSVPWTAISSIHTGFAGSMATFIGLSGSMAVCVPVIGVAVGATTAVAMHTFMRCAHDIGIRDEDVHAVRVEDLQQFRRNSQ